MQMSVQLYETYNFPVISHSLINLCDQLVDADPERRYRNTGNGFIFWFMTAWRETGTARIA